MANKIHISKDTVDALEPKGKTQRFSDTDIEGFKVKITPAGNKSYIFVYFDKSGKRREYSIGRHGKNKTAIEARKEATRLWDIINAGGDPLAEKEQVRGEKNINELHEIYYETHMQPNLAASSIRNNIYRWNKMVAPEFGKKKPSEITTRMIVDWINKYKVKGPSDINRARAHLHTFFNKMSDWEYIVPRHNPVTGTPIQKESKRERFASTEEITKLINGLKTMEKEGRYDVACVRVFELLLYTGCRPIEILKLEWQYIDREKKYIRFPDTYTKEKKDKVIFITPQVAEVLDKLKPTPDSPYVFPSLKDKMKHIESPRRPWKHLMEITGIKDFPLYSLRHTFASVAIMNGVPLQVVGGLMGHNRVETTMRYAHLADDVKRDAAEEISQVFASQAEKSAKVIPFAKR